MKQDLPMTLSVSGTLGETEKAKILAVLEEVGGNRTKAAERLGISRRTIYRKLEEYGL
jgi:transcriptional regulator of acetoin/glycerol metabolism